MMNGPSYQSAEYLHLHNYLLLARFSNDLKLDMPQHASGCKEALHSVPKQEVEAFDRVIHQVSIKPFYWSQHYQAVFLGDDREGEGTLLKTDLSWGIIFIFMMTLQ